MVDPAALREALAHASEMVSDYMHLSGMVTGEFAVGQAEHKAAAKHEDEWAAQFNLIHSAAREFLRLMETAETVWWCEEHQSGLNEPGDSMCLRASYVDTDLQVGAPWATDCRMVEAVLTRRDT